MPYQNYQANVSFGSNITNYFVVTANTLQEAAAVALHRYDTNTAVVRANSNSSVYVGNTLATLTVANTGSQATVKVLDPFNPAQAWVFTVQAPTPLAPTPSLYAANGIGAAYTTP